MREERIWGRKAFGGPGGERFSWMKTFGGGKDWGRKTFGGRQHCRRKDLIG